MATVNVGILGLGRLGASLGLALKHYSQQPASAHQFNIAAYDSHTQNVKVAQEIGAVDEVKNRPEEIAKGKDIIFMTLPAYEAETVYPLISHTLRQGAVVFDFTSFKQNMLAFAEEHLASKAHVVSMSALVNPKYLFYGIADTEHASADYFDKGIMLVMPSVRADKGAIALATDVSNILGAVPHFFDPAEYDALSVATEALPALLATTYFYSLSKSAGWLDMGRIANPDFAMFTHDLYDTHPDDLRASWLQSSEELVRHLDNVISNLSQVRSALIQKDAKGLTMFLDESAEQYELWLNRRIQPEWELSEKIKPETATIRGLMRGMFGGFIVPDKKDNKPKR